MPTEIIPLGGSAQGSDVTYLIERIENFVPVLVTPVIGGKNQLKLAKRRGFQNRLVAAASGYTINEVAIWNGVQGTGTAPPTTRGVIVYAASKAATDLKLYKWNTSETTLGTFAGADYQCIGIQETLISGVANLTLNIGNLNSPHDQKLLFFPNGGALTEVTDADFPTTSIGRGVHMDGYYFIASTDGYIYNSDLNSLSSWTAGNRVAVQMSPDSLVGLGLLGSDIIVAFGLKSIEFYRNAGNASGSPLSRIPGGLGIGCINGSCIQPYGKSLMFLSAGEDAVGARILEAVGVEPKKVSTPLIDRELNSVLSANSGGPLRSGIYYGPSLRGIITEHGTSGIAAGIPKDSSPSNFKDLFVYYPQFDTWGRFSLGDSSSTTGIFSAPFVSQPGVSLTVNSIGGILYKMETDSYATSGKDYNAIQFTASVQSVPMTHGTARMKTYHQARLIGDQQTVATPVILSYSDNDGVSFTAGGTFDMSVNPIIALHRLGRSRKRVWKLSNTSAGGCVIDALELTYDIEAM